MSVLKWLLSLALGATVGVAAGVTVAVAVGAWGQRQYPNDPSAGSGAIIVMLTAPVGLVLGLVAGARLADRWVKHRKGGE